MEKNNSLNIGDFEAVIFDMDGVLVDSEPIWKIAMEEVFRSIGCHLTRKDFAKTVGLRLDEVVSYWHAVAQWQQYSNEEVVRMIISKMADLLKKDSQPMSGVVDTLHFLKDSGIKIGLATSSYEVLVDTVLSTHNLKQYFQYTHSAENERYGKPHPAVYLSCAEKLNVSPLKCLVIEDSLNGVISGKAARMKVVCIPEKTHVPEPKLMIADFMFDSMSALLEAVRSN